MNSIANKYILFFLLLLFISIPHAQSFDDLLKFTEGEVHVYYSNGFEERAERMSRQINEATSYGDSVFDFRPEVRLLVLDKKDWPVYTQLPVYGMPHYTDNYTLIVAAENNQFWDNFLPPLDKLDKTTRAKIEHTYRDKNDRINMIRFFDLAAVHELAHAFHKQANLNMQRLWLQEFFCNLFMFVYIAENEPELIPVLEVFSNMVVNSGTQGYEYLSLQDFQQNYHSIAQEAPKNYGWYQCKMNMGAIEAYRNTGPDILKDLWQFLSLNEQIKNDSVLLSQMKKQVDVSLAKVFTEWK